MFSYAPARCSLCVERLYTPTQDCLWKKVTLKSGLYLNVLVCDGAVMMTTKFTRKSVSSWTAAQRRWFWNLVKENAACWVCRKEKTKTFFVKKKKVVTVVWRLKLSLISGDKQIIMTPTQSTLNVFRSLPVLIYPTPMPFPEISVLIRPYVKVENNDNNPFLSRFLSTSSGRKRNRKLKLI